MKNKLWITAVSCLAYCVDKELCKAIDYLKEQVSEKQLRYVLSEFLDYYHVGRVHQSLGKIIEPKYEGNTGEIFRIERLGGLLKSYYRKAA